MKTMKFYITEQTKQEIGNKIAELEEVKRNCKTDYEWNEAVIEQNTYKQILSSAIILPIVGQDWENKGVMSLERQVMLHTYPQGVIFHPKKQ
jgi:hypothetical protein